MPTMKQVTMLQTFLDGEMHHADHSRDIALQMINLSKEKKEPMTFLRSEMCVTKVLINSAKIEVAYKVKSHCDQCLAKGMSEDDILAHVKGYIAIEINNLGFPDSTDIGPTALYQIYMRSEYLQVSKFIDTIIQG